MPWMVLRMDDGGVRFLVRDGLDHDTAARCCATFTARAHKQTYSVLEYAVAERAAVLAAHAIQEYGGGWSPAAPG